MLLLLRKKRGGKSGHAQNLLPIRTASGHGLFRPRDFVTYGQKTPTSADMAQLPVAYLIINTFLPRVRINYKYFFLHRVRVRVRS